MTTEHWTLASPPRAFEVDHSWYGSYWYDRHDQPGPELTKPMPRFLQVLSWATVFAAAAYFAS
jgi:hypothetical protein